MNILLIGGTRFVGLHTANEFITQGHTVTLFHRHPYTGTLLSPQARHIYGDRDHAAELANAIREAAPDVIVDTYALTQQNVDVLEAALERRTRVVTVSSVDVYEAYARLSQPGKTPQKTPLTEDSALRSALYPYRGVLNTPFAHDYEKILVEKAALSSPHMDAIILRLGMIYGENDGNHRFRSFIQSLERSEDMVMPRNMASWTASKGYVKDIAHGIYLAAMKGRSGEIYNLAEERPVSEEVWFHRIATLLHREPRLQVEDRGDKTANWKQHLTVDTTKIREQLGYTEQYTIEDALKNALHWELESGI